MYVSLCLIARDENSYLQEWLDYHILLGVKHFWIYDNESAVPLSATLSEYIQNGWVTVNTIRGRAMQLHAYDHCLRTYGQASTWMGFIDTDEFIVPRIPGRLDDFLKGYESYGGLALSSLFFGHDGNRKRPGGGQIGAYRTRTPETFSYNRLIKSIVRPEAVLNPISPHSFLYKENFFCVNEAGQRVDAQDYPCHVEKIQLNHYFTRSVDEWNQKVSRGRGDSDVKYKDERASRVERYAAVKDTAILDLILHILPEASPDAAKWKMRITPDSPFLSNLLHQEAMKLSPSRVETFWSGEAVPRPELVDYYREVEYGIRLFEEGRLADARDFWVSQIERFPFDPLRYTNFSIICVRLQDFQSAWKALANAWRIAPQSLFVLIAMSEYFFAIGDYAQAEKTSLLAASLGEPKPEGLALLALCQWKQGKQKEAKITAQPLLEHVSLEEDGHPIFKELFTALAT
jgi:hypothetical protein